MSRARDESEGEDESRGFAAELEERVDEALDGDVADAEDVEDAFLSE